MALTQQLDAEPWSHPDAKPDDCTSHTDSSSDTGHSEAGGDASSPATSSPASSSRDESPLVSSKSSFLAASSGASSASPLRSQLSYLRMSISDAVRAYVLLRPPRGSDASSCGAAPRNLPKPSQPLTPAEETRLQEGALASLSLKLCSGSLHIAQLLRLLRPFAVDAKSTAEQTRGSRGRSQPAADAGAEQDEAEERVAGDEGGARGDATDAVGRAKGAAVAAATGDAPARPNLSSAEDRALEDDSVIWDSAEDEEDSSSAPNAFARNAQRRRRAALLLGEVLQRVPSLSLSAAPPSAGDPPAGEGETRVDPVGVSPASGEASVCNSGAADERSTLSQIVGFCLENLNDWYVVEGACAALLALLTHHRDALRAERVRFVREAKKRSAVESPKAPEEAPGGASGELPGSGDEAPAQVGREGEAATAQGDGGREARSAERARAGGEKSLEGGKSEEESLVEAVLRRLLCDVHAPAFAQNVRQLILRLLLALLRECEPEVAALARRRKEAGGVQVVTAVCTQLEGERDPRCLLLLFEIVAVLGASYASIMRRDEVENVVDVVMTYFPIAFSPPPNAPIPITEETLVERFHRALTSTPLFSSFVLLYLLDALASAGDEDFQQTLEEIKKTAAAVLPHFPPSAVLAVLQPVQGLMLQSCYEAPSVHTAQLVAVWVLFLRRAVQAEDGLDADGEARWLAGDERRENANCALNRESQRGQRQRVSADDAQPAADSENGGAQPRGAAATADADALWLDCFSPPLAAPSASAALLAAVPPALPPWLLHQVRPLLAELFAPLLDFDQAPGSPACVAARQFLLRSAVISETLCRLCLEICVLPLLRLTLASCPTPRQRSPGGGSHSLLPAESESVERPDDAPSAGAGDAQEDALLDEAWDAALVRAVATVHTVERFITLGIAAGLLPKKDACPASEAGLLLLRLGSLFRATRSRLLSSGRSEVFVCFFQAIGEVAALPQQFPELRDDAVRMFASLLGFSAPSSPPPFSRALAGNATACARRSNPTAPSDALKPNGLPMELGGEEAPDTRDAPPDTRDAPAEAELFHARWVTLLEMTLRLQGLSAVLTSPSSLLLGALRALQQVLLACGDAEASSSLLSNLLQGGAVCVRRKRNVAGNGEAEKNGARSPADDSLEEDSVEDAAAAERERQEILLDFVEELSPLAGTLAVRAQSPIGAAGCSGDGDAGMAPLASAVTLILSEAGSQLLCGSWCLAETHQHRAGAAGSRARGCGVPGSLDRGNEAAETECLSRTPLSLLPAGARLEVALAIAAVLLGRSNVAPSFSTSCLSRSPLWSAAIPRCGACGASSPPSASLPERSQPAAPVDEALACVSPQKDAGQTEPTQANTLDELQASMFTLLIASAAQAASSSAGLMHAAMRSRRGDETDRPTGANRSNEEANRVVATSVLQVVTQGIIDWLQIRSMATSAGVVAETPGDTLGSSLRSSGCPFDALLRGLEQATYVALSEPVSPLSSSSSVVSLLPRLRYLLSLLLHSAPRVEAKQCAVALLSRAARQEESSLEEPERAAQQGSAHFGREGESGVALLLLTPAALAFLAAVPEDRRSNCSGDDGAASGSFSSLLERLLHRCLSLMTEPRRLWSADIGVAAPPAGSASASLTASPSRAQGEEAWLPSEKVLLDVVVAILYFAPAEQTLQRLIGTLKQFKGREDTGTVPQGDDVENAEADASSVSPWERDYQSTMWQNAIVKGLCLRQEVARRASEHALASEQLHELLRPVFAPAVALRDSRSEARHSLDKRACVRPGHDAKQPAPARLAATAAKASVSVSSVRSAHAESSLFVSLSSSLAVARLLGDTVLDGTADLLANDGEEAKRGAETAVTRISSAPRRDSAEEATETGDRDSRNRSREERVILPGLLSLLPCAAPASDSDTERDKGGRGDGECLRFRLSGEPLQCVARHVLYDARAAVGAMRRHLVAQGAADMRLTTSACATPLGGLAPPDAAEEARGASLGAEAALRLRLAALPAAACLARAAASLPVEEVLLYGLDGAYDDGELRPPERQAGAAPADAFFALGPQPQRGLLATVVIWVVSFYFAVRRDRPTLHPGARGLLRGLAGARRRREETDGRRAQQADGDETALRDSSGALTRAPAGAAGEAGLAAPSPGAGVSSGRFVEHLLFSLEEAEDVLLSSTLLLILSAQRRKRLLRVLAALREAPASQAGSSGAGADVDAAGVGAPAGASPEPSAAGGGSPLGSSGDTAEGEAEGKRTTLEKWSFAEAPAPCEPRGSLVLEEMELQFLDQAVGLILPFLLTVAQQGCKDDVEARERGRRRQARTLGDVAARPLSVPEGGFAGPVLRLLAIQAVMNYADRPLGVIRKMQKEVVAGISPALDDPVRLVRRAAAVCKNRWTVRE
ncbi:hypothetical protein BESB_079800 [Besnoitia besnoiti]|uniref:MMS19 nucleotide excision repair protein n=1 Tax=Besnoitia besnoiti TaxID=94643 RepID=A0A2A9M987_BESBE|nr:hypothetical protein BESB_079800 [Besnoitia besnoiti]PFH33764.1 hypothetical protein BESB_079800 [Besnoitia besnoiti]